jgi:predicted murein hydrolase (TIGR00659 family)
MLNIHKIIESPILWLCLTISIYKLSEHFKKYRLLSKIPPTCIAAIAIILLINICSVDYKSYNSGGIFISYILGPATIALSLPLIKNIEILRQNWKIIVIGVVMATITGIMSVFLIATLLKATHPIILSLVAKSVTTPIAVEISKSIGGIPELTACIVILTGLTGALFGHKILKAVNVHHDISIGLAIGASSHVIGTSSCIEKSEIQAAISSISLILTGILTAIIAPIITRIIF